MALPMAFTYDPSMLATGSYTYLLLSYRFCPERFGGLLVIFTGYRDPGDRGLELHLGEKGCLPHP